MTIACFCAFSEHRGYTEPEYFGFGITVDNLPRDDDDEEEEEEEGEEEEEEEGD